MTAEAPTTWAALLSDGAAIDKQQQQLASFAEEAGDPAAMPDNALYLGVDCVMGGRVLLGPQAVRPALEAAARANLGRKGIAAVVAKARPAQAQTLINVLTAANACAACGRDDFAARPKEAEALLEGAAPAVVRLRDGTRFRAALAAVAYDLPDLAATYAFGKPRAFKPGESFGPNLQALVHYLVAAAKAGAGGDDVDPAIRSAVDVFPYKLFDQQLMWGDLGWLGRLRFHKFGGEPLGEVGERMFDYVRTL